MIEKVIFTMIKELTHEPFALILTGASGAGKGTIGKALRKEFSSLKLSVSATTRAKRPGEVEGVDYFFYSQEEFMQAIKDEKMMEWAEVFGQYYGTPLKPVLDDFAKSHDVLFDIDWQGARQIKEKLGIRAINIHILPPSKEILKQRLIERGQDSMEVIEGRMVKAASEISHWKDCDYVIVNHELEAAIKEAKVIFLAECRRRIRLNYLDGIAKEFE
ncbi:MAG: guanylate kinase [Alphaproteobacteria bacterium]